GTVAARPRRTDASRISARRVAVSPAVRRYGARCRSARRPDGVPPPHGPCFVTGLPSIGRRVGPVVVAVLALSAAHARALTTEVLDYNFARCLIGEPDGRCPDDPSDVFAYDRAHSILRAIEIDRGAAARRVDDLADRIWSAPDLGQIVLRARYAERASTLGYGPRDGGPADFVPLVGQVDDGTVLVASVAPFAEDPMPGDFVSDPLAASVT